MPDANGRQTVFFSWQSDAPSASNRGLIKSALEDAVVALERDESIDEAPRVDDATAGVPGAPDIARTVLEKIESATVFVADVSLVLLDAQSGRRSPNPNVLFELGYAWRVLGPERVLLIMNASFGSAAQLPFDLRGQRVKEYESAPVGGDRAGVRSRLAGHFALAIKTIVEGVPRRRRIGPELRLEFVDAGTNDRVGTLLEVESRVLRDRPAPSPEELEQFPSLRASSLMEGIIARHAMPEATFAAKFGPTTKELLDHKRAKALLVPVCVEVVNEGGELARDVIVRMSIPRTDGLVVRDRLPEQPRSRLEFPDMIVPSRHDTFVETNRADSFDVRMDVGKVQPHSTAVSDCFWIGSDRAWTADVIARVTGDNVSPALEIPMTLAIRTRAGWIDDDSSDVEGDA